MTLRVVMAEDNALLRDGIGLLLAENAIDVLTATDNAAELIDAVTAYQPDLAIIDVRLPPSFTNEGILAALTIRRAHPATAVLVLSQWVEVTYANQLLDANPTKVGYLLKDRVMRSADFISAIRQVAAGGTVMDPEVVRQLLAARSVDLSFNRLTPRERDVLALLAEGRSNQAIADHLHLALRSIEKVISSNFLKLGLTDDTHDHRRVLAVLHYLSTHNDPAPSRTASRRNAGPS